MKIAINQSVTLSELDFWEVNGSDAVSMSFEQAAMLARIINDTLQEQGYELGAYDPELGA